MKEKSMLGHIMAILCVTVWGSTFAVSKSLMSFLVPIQLMLLRFIVAYIALWIIYPKWHFHIKEEWKFVLFGLFSDTIYFLAENTALTLTHSSNVSILVSTSPVIAAIAMRVLYPSESLSRRQIIGYAVAFAGVICVVLNGALALKMNPLGDLLALGAAASWATYCVLL